MSMKRASARRSFCDVRRQEPAKAQDFLRSLDEIGSCSKLEHAEPASSLRAWREPSRAAARQQSLRDFWG
jgi:hypothetical protein